MSKEVLLKTDTKNEKDQIAKLTPRTMRPGQSKLTLSRKGLDLVESLGSEQYNRIYGQLNIKKKIEKEKTDEEPESSDINKSILFKAHLQEKKASLQDAKVNESTPPKKIEEKKHFAQSILSAKGHNLNFSNQNMKLLKKVVKKSSAINDALQQGNKFGYQKISIGQTVNNTKRSMLSKTDVDILLKILFLKIKIYFLNELIILGE